MEPTYSERMAAARQRLTHALAATTDQESATLDWLGKFDLPTLETLAGMLERALRAETAAAYQRGANARADVAAAHGYDQGWTEAVQYCREQAARGVPAHQWDDVAGGGDDAA